LIRAAAPPAASAFGGPRPQQQPLGDRHFGPFALAAAAVRLQAERAAVQRSVAFSFDQVSRRVLKEKDELKFGIIFK